MSTNNSFPLEHLSPPLGRHDNDVDSITTSMAESEDVGSRKTISGYRLSRKPTGHAYAHAASDDEVGVPLVLESAGTTSNPITFRTICRLFVWWLPELGASVLSAVSLACIVYILRTFRGRSATDVHLPKPLTLNGLLAVVATINKACLTVPVYSAMMQEMWIYFAAEAKAVVCKSRLQEMELYTNASIGTLGSLVFLVHTRGTRLIACLGCVITILSLAYSTFTQQLIGFAVLPDPNINSLSNLPHSDWFSYQGDPTLLRGVDWVPPPEMISAIYSGILTSTTEPSLADCPSGNCTWPLTSSLAVCGGCADSTYTLLGCTASLCAEVQEDNDPNAATYFGQDCVNKSSCDYALPSGSTVTLLNPEAYVNMSAAQLDAFTLPIFQVGTTFSNATGSGNLYAAGSGNLYKTGLFSDFPVPGRIYIANANLFGFPYNYSGSTHPPLSNVECALWFCIQTYNTTITSTQQHQAVVSTYDQFFWSSNLDLQAIVPDAISAGGQINFMVDMETALTGLGPYFNHLFNGTVIYEWGYGPAYTTDVMRSLWNGSSSDPQGFIDNLATSMTNVVRSYNISRRPELNGTSFQLAITVRWEWLILPAALVFLSIIFLLTVMIRTANSSVASWKGSPLTLLLFDMDKDIVEAAYGNVDKRNGISDAIGQKKVRLVNGPGGVRKLRAC